jgi:hypothetical protein
MPDSLVLLTDGVSSRIPSFRGGFRYPQEDTLIRPDTLWVRPVGVDCHNPSFVWIGFVPTREPVSSRSVAMLGDKYFLSARGVSAGPLVFQMLNATAALDSAMWEQSDSGIVILGAAARRARIAEAGRIADSLQAAADRQAETQERARIRAMLMHAGASPEQVRAVLAHQVQLGMTRLMVRAAWGEPTGVTVMQTEFGVGEAWTYGAQGLVVFVNGQVRVISRQN